MLTVIVVTMCIFHLPLHSFIYAETEIAKVTCSDVREGTKRITVDDVHENIKKIALKKKGIILETKDVRDSITFDVYTNGKYTLIGYDEQGQEMRQQTVSITGFEDLKVSEDKASQKVTILSRYEDTDQIRVSGADDEILDVTESKPGVYQAVYTVKKNGSYGFAVVGINGATLEETTLYITGMPDFTETGEILLHNEEDLSQIVSHPDKDFILAEDIVMTKDVLKQVDFTGSLNGQGYVISGSDVLFHSIDNATIKNMVVKGSLASFSSHSLIENCGFYIENADREKNAAVILKSDDTAIKNSFAFLNVEGKQTAGFLLDGSGTIEDSYVSGYLYAEEKAYGFGKAVDVKNSYLSASVNAKERELFSKGTLTDCFYDAQINDIENEEAKAYFTSDMTSGELHNQAFKESAGRYPQIKGIDSFKGTAQEVSSLSVVSVKSKSNLSALESSVDYEESKDINWEKNNEEITAARGEMINRFALKSARVLDKAVAGASTTSKTTQITYPVTMGSYYKVTKKDAESLLPKTHKEAIEQGWKLMYWSGSNTASNLSWNTEYSILHTDLKELQIVETLTTKKGKNGGKLIISGTYDVGQEMIATLTAMNTTKGTMVWESAEKLDAEEWTPLQTAEIAEGTTTNTYTVKETEKGRYLRVRFLTDEDSGYFGSLYAKTENILQRPLTAVSIENKTANNAAMTVRNELVANVEPAGKESEVIFRWYHDGEPQEIAIGRNYVLKPEDAGKQMVVKATAKKSGVLKGEKTSEKTAVVQTISQQPADIAKLKEVEHDDITVTVSMETDEGLYQIGYALSDNDTITPYKTLSRANTKLTITGLKPHTTYYLYVRQIGESGYSDSDWSADFYQFTTDAEHISGDVMISGEAVYNRTLTAHIKNKPAAHTGTFVWYRLDENSSRIVDTKVEGDTYTLSKDDIGHKVEAVYEGTNDFAGEVSNISETVIKEEKAAPNTNLNVMESTSETDTTIEVQLPVNTDGENYIVGISKTRNGIPIEVQEDNKVKEFSSGMNYRITGLQRDTEYFLFIRYAANATHEKSDWITPDLAVKKRTDKKPFAGSIEFVYETAAGTLSKGQTVKAALSPEDSSFHYQGTWTWTKTVNEKRIPIQNFTLASNRKSTSYKVPVDEETGAVYHITFTANTGYEGSIEADTVSVQEPIKEKYAEPDVNSIVLKQTDDSSIKVMMNEGEGQYQFWYKKDDTSPVDSLQGFFSELLSNDDGYIKADKTVGSNVDLEIGGLDRNTRYIVKVQRIADTKGEASDFVYSSDADTEYTSVTTAKTNIAGHVTLTGKERYGETLSARYNEASYASTGSGSDQNGTWKWYRDNTEIAAQTDSTYQLVKEDIGKVIKAEYTMPEHEAFEGTVSAQTKVIEKAECVNPEITKIESKDNNGTLTMTVSGTLNTGEDIYYRLQEAKDTAPSFPNAAEMSTWHKVKSSTMQITEDVKDAPLQANETYTIYYIKLEGETQKSSAVLSKNYRMGTKNQTGTITYTGDFVIGKSVKAALTGANNHTNGTWHWYMSKNRHAYELTAMPSITDAGAWTEITSGFSSNSNEGSSTLAITEDMFAHYIRCEFVADSQQGYSGAVQSNQAQYVKKIYVETVTITSSTKDGNHTEKAYSNSTVTGKIENYMESGKLDRDTIQFKIADKNGSGATYVNGNSLTITDQHFTYKLPENAISDGKEITAEVSPPKKVSLYVDKDLKALSSQVINSKTSTNTAIEYASGIPIANATDMANFLKSGSGFEDRSATYIITDNIDMQNANITPNEVTGAGAFSGTLNGDYHTLVNMKTYVVANLKNGCIKNLILNNSQAATPTASGPGVTDAAYQCATAVVAYTDSGSTSNLLENIMVTQSELHGRYDGGGILGKVYGKGNVVRGCTAAGVTIYNEDSGMHILGGLVGYVRGGQVKVEDCFTVNSKIVDNHQDAALGGLVGGTTDASSSTSTAINRTFSASSIPAADGAGGLIGREITNSYTDSRNIAASYYDTNITNMAFPYESGRSESYIGKGLTTKEMIGSTLSGSFGTDAWVYLDGYYPRLTWIASHPIAKLYTATRGSFTSVDKKTTNDQMFDGNIYGVIQIPAELLTKDYSVRILDVNGNASETVLKKGDNGTILPVGKAGEKAIVEITYTEPDTTIGGSASNTYEFTVQQTVKAMSQVVVKDGNAALTGSPKMNQTLSASASGSTYQWYKRKSGTTKNIAIDGATAQTYTVKPADIGYELAVLVTTPGYASTFSNFTSTVTAIKPQAPLVSEVSDNSVTVKPQNGEEGLTYEFSYMRTDANSTKTIAEDTCTSSGSVIIENLERNRQYSFFVRVAGKTGSYEAGEWSEGVSKTLARTPVEGPIVLGSAINNGKLLTMKVDSVNGQTGSWKLERLKADSDQVDSVINENMSEENSCSYMLSQEDVGKRIRITYTGRGDFENSIVTTTQTIQKAMPDTVPSSPVEISKTDSSLRVKVEQAGTYDIGYAKSSSDAIHVCGENVSGNTVYEINGLNRNTSYYVYARSSADEGSVPSNWSAAAVYTTDKTKLNGTLTIQGDTETDQELRVNAPSLSGLSGIWKVERLQDSATTTIAPRDYSYDTSSIVYRIIPKDAGSNVKITFTGTGDYTGAISVTSDAIRNTKQSNTTDMPSDCVASDIQDHAFSILAKDGNTTYQFGCAPEGTEAITWASATAEHGKKIRLVELKRNTVYDIYVRKAAKKGYEPSDPVKMPTSVRTGKTILNGSLDYEMPEGNAVLGVAEVGKTYQVNYKAGSYEQSGNDMDGSWQWYADQEPIADATTNTFTIAPMEGNPEIRVRYQADGDSDFRNYITLSIGTLTKPQYEALNAQPDVEAEPEDGETGSKLRIKATEYDHVYYYIQEAEQTKIPTVKVSSEVIENPAALHQWFPAQEETVVKVKADTDYVVYAARLEDGSYQCSDIISTKTVHSAKEDLTLLETGIEEADTTAWKVLQDKELRIQSDHKAVEGIWQYYVTKDKTVEDSWQNITAEMKKNVQEGKKEDYSYTRISMPVKYNGFYLRAVFTGRGSYEGNKAYVSENTFIGTQIQGSITIVEGEESNVFTPVKVSYVFAKDVHGEDIKDEKNGVWTWYRETAVNSGTYEEIKRSKEHVGLSDTYVPTAEDVDKRIYAEYAGAPEGIYSGKTVSVELQKVSKAQQETPIEPAVKQVNGTTIQILTPSNYKAEGKTIPSRIIEYRVKGSNTAWTRNDDGSTWLGMQDKLLKANTTYEIRVKFSATGEYLESSYSNVIEATTENKSFDEDRLRLDAPDKLEINSEIKASYAGEGYDEGTFKILRSDGTVVDETPPVTNTENAIQTSYTVTSDDIGNNIIVQYYAMDHAETYGGMIEKSSAEVLKPQNPAAAETPSLKFVQFDETVLKAEIRDTYEYVLNESSIPVPESDGDWKKLTADEDGYHTFTNLNKNKTYYLHARIAETQTNRSSAESVSAPAKAWADTMHSITYAGMDKAVNGTPMISNPTQFTELSETITLLDAYKDGYIFTGWTSNEIETPTKNVTIPQYTTVDQKFTANWEIITYDIQYDPNGGEWMNEEANPATYTIESENILIRNPEKKGYTFSGWTWDGEAVPQTEVMIPKGSFGDKKYSAHWELDKYSIRYELHGGINAGENPSQYSITSEDIDIMEPVRTGYDFIGWTWEGQPDPMKSVKIRTGSTGDIQYTANWKAINYTITYDLDGGGLDSENSNPEGYTIESADIVLRMPVKENYTFIGWTFEGQDQPEKDIRISKGTYGNLHYTANWKLNEYVVSYQSNAGSSVSDVLIKHGSMISKPEDPVRAGYAFAGWYKEEYLQSEWNFEEDSVTHDVTLYAKWNIHTYTAVFDKNGADSVTAKTISKNYQEALGVLPVALRKGYTFTGWYTAKNGGKKIDGTTPMPLDGAVYYAHWKINTYKITYDLTDKAALNHASNSSVYTFEDETLTLHAPTWKGHTFLGWTYDGQSSPKQEVIISKGSIGDRTFTAHWKLNSYTITFETNGDTSPEKQTIPYGGKVDEPDTPFKTGYVFKGWYADKACTKSWDFTTDSVTEDMTLYSGYRKILDPVTADRESGTHLRKGDTVVLTAEKGAEIYYTLDGSSPTKDSRKYTDRIRIEKTVTIKAIAVKEEYAHSRIEEFTYFVKGKGTVDVGKSPVRIQHKQDEFLEAVLTIEEYQNYLNGSDVKIRFSCEPVDPNGIEEIQELLNGRTAAYHYDINMYKKLDNGHEKKVEVLSQPIRIVLDVPEALYPDANVMREFKILRVHEGKNALLDDLDQKTETVTFETDAFSRYILCYSDNVYKNKKPATSVNSNEEVKEKDQNHGDENLKKQDDSVNQKQKDKPLTGVKEEKENQWGIYILLMIALIFCILIGLVRRKKC